VFLSFRFFRSFVQSFLILLFSYPFISVFLNYRKILPGLCFDGEHKRLLSGSLDHHVKVYDLQSYQVVHDFKYTAPVLSVAASVRNQLFSLCSKINQVYAAGQLAVGGRPCLRVPGNPASRRHPG
jgi:hypothetical protein